MSWKFWKNDKRLDMLDEEIKSFHNKLDGPLKPADLKNKFGEGIEDIQTIQGYGNISLSSFNLFYKQYINRAFENEMARIREYRNIAEMPEIADVIEDAVNESTQENDDGETLTLEIKDEKLKQNENIVSNLQDEFKDLFYNKININDKLWDIFRSYYIDGRVYYERIINTAHPKNGIIGIKKLPTESMDYIINPISGEIVKFFQYLSERPKRPNSIEEAELAKDIIVFDPNQISFVNYGVYGNNKYEILGYLEKAKVPFNQLKLLETSVIIYRIVRAPERFVFRIDTGAMPMDKAMKFVEKVKSKMTKKQSFDPTTGRLTQEPEVLCIRKNTEIPLLDGRYLKLEDIVKELKQGKENWVYTINQKTLDIEPGKIKRAEITRLNEKLIRVWFDNDEYIDTTYDHKFILRDGTECRADELKVNQSLMPLYKKFEKISYNGNLDYEKILNHKVTKIEYISERDDTGCLEIEGNHNFAVSRNGKPLVFIRNSILENFYLPQCLRTSTKIDLLDGRTLTLKEIIDEHNNGQKHEVYSVDQKTGKIIRGEVEWAGITRKNAKMIRVWLDNDEYIDVTPDHKFILRDGSECRADRLSEGKSLMPFYTRNEKINENTNEYKQVFDLEQNEWKFVHRIMGPLPQKGMATHHINFNRFDNMRSNLEQLDIKEHIKLHYETNKLRNSHIPLLEALNKPENREKQRKSARKQMIERFSNPAERQKVSKIVKERWSNDEEYREKMTTLAKMPKSQSHKNSLSESIKNKWKDEEYREKSSKSSKDRWNNEDFSKMMSEKQHCIVDEKCRYFVILEILKSNFPSFPLIIKKLSLNKDFMNHWSFINKDKKNVRKDKMGKKSFYHIIKSFGVNGYGELKDSIVINHKVTKIEILNEREDTGCLTIKDSGNNHNFALSVGVFVKNSGDGRGSQIDTIGGNSAGFTELQDIYYFARKLFRALKYPLSRVSAGEEKREADVLFGGSNTAEITRDEIKWAKFLERQQKRICDDFKKIFLLHLEFKNLNEQYGIKDDDIEVNLGPPSHYKEQMEQAFLATSFDNYNAMSDKPEISKYFAMKEYLNWDDETIRENVKGHAKDKELGLIKSESENAYQ